MRTRPFRTVEMPITPFDPPTIVPPRLRIACVECRARLTLHLPDPQLPDRMIGSCEECGEWFLIDLDAAVLVRLPAGEELHLGPD